MKLSSAAAGRAAKSFWGFSLCRRDLRDACLAIYKLTPTTKTAPPRRLWTPLIINNLNVEMIVPDTLRLEVLDALLEDQGLFLAKDLKNAGETNRNWEIIESDDRVTQFGEYLRKDVEVIGYRRTEVWATVVRV